MISNFLFYHWKYNDYDNVSSIDGYVVTQSKLITKTFTSLAVGTNLSITEEFTSDIEGYWETISYRNTNPYLYISGVYTTSTTTSMSFSENWQTKVAITSTTYIWIKVWQLCTVSSYLAQIS